MKLPLFVETVEVEDCKFPLITKLMLKTNKPSIPHPFNEKNVSKGREKDIKQMETKIGQIMHGTKYPVHKIEHITLTFGEETARGRIYIPNEDDNLPVMLFYHGGGYVIGGLKNYEYFCRNLCFHTKSIVVMIEYSLAPEYRFPTAVNDAWKILEWTNDHISNYQDDPTQIYVIGDSAGGGLAAIVGRDYTTKSSSKITGTILIYPWVDQHQNYPSHEKFGKGYGLTNEYLQFFTNCYKNNDDDLKNPDFSPIFAPNLTKHAKTLIFLASHDPLRDAGLVYAKKLQEHNIPTKIKTYQPTIHGFMQYYSVLPRGKEIIQDFMNTIKVWIKR